MNPLLISNYDDFFLNCMHLTQWTIDQYTLATLNIVMIVTKILLWTSKQCVITAPYLWIKVNKNSLASKSSQKTKNKTITANCYTLTINESQQSHFSLYFYDIVIIICRQRKEYILNFPNNYMPNVLISNLEKQSN